MAFDPQRRIVVNERMDLDTTRFTLRLTVNKLGKLRKKTERIRSAGITMRELGQDEFQGRWRILVYPCFTKTEEGDNKSYVGVFLLLTDVSLESVSYKSDKSVDAEYAIRVGTGKEAKIIASIDSRGNTFCLNHYAWGVPTLVSHGDLFGDEKKPGLLKDDSITIVIDVTMYGKLKSVIVPEIVTDLSARRQQFLRRQADWKVHQQCTDFKIRSSDGQTFLTHRLLLMSHSPVFAAMLESSSKAKRPTRCELDDLNDEMVVVLLEYVHGCNTGMVTPNNAEKVLIMADKYEILDLRAVCEDILAQNVTAENAVHCLVLASQRKLDRLQESALNVIPKNMGTVLQNGALQEALQFDPELMQTIMEHCSKRVRLNDMS